MQHSEVLTKLGIEWSDSHKHSRPGWIQIKFCPHCHSQNYHLGLRTDYGYLNCFRCGHHNLAQTLATISRQSIYSIRELLGEVPGARKKEAEPTLRPVDLYLPESIPFGPSHRRYLRSRGFNPKEIAKLWGARGTGAMSSIRWRILIPIYMRGKLVSWTARSIGDAIPKYITCPNSEAVVERNEILYGLDSVPGHVVYIVEGPLDVWGIGPGAVCPMGLEISRKQIAMIAEYPIRVVVFDPEPAAQKRAAKLCRQLEVFKGETARVILDSGDPGEADRDEIKELRMSFNDWSE